MAEYLELVEGSFNESHFNKQQNQNPYVAYSIRDNKVIYTIIPKEEGTMYTIYRVVSKDISNCTYNMVDLGLSVKWADRNVGATSPEHYGSYFQWGDTNAYTFDGAGEITAAELAEILNPILSPQLGEEITADNIGAILEQMGMTSTDLTPMGIGRVLGKFFNWDSYNNEVDVITGWEEDEDGNRYPTGFKKYNSGENGLTVLESGDDAATVYMGSSYRMPTIDEIRELRDNVKILPTTSKYKVYIIDEVHMLSIGAFNALLKTLEEPPEHVIFILATTDPQKVPSTIISRCQCFNFNRLADEIIVEIFVSPVTTPFPSRSRSPRFT